jgi:hypothetical protein
MSFILVFDIPREDKLLKLRVNRLLHKIDAKKLQFSVWKSERLADLIDVANLIRGNKGSASILEEKFIF